MAIRKTEHPNFTNEQVEAHVREAVAIADDCQLSDADRAALLPVIMEKLSSQEGRLTSCSCGGNAWQSWPLRQWPPTPPHPGSATA